MHTVALSLLLTAGLAAPLRAELKPMLVRHTELFEHERPPAAFDHDGHLKAIPDVKCTLCHRPGPMAGIATSFLSPEEKSDKKLYMQRYHSVCLACHGRGTEKPLACGECHDKRAESAPRRVFYEHSAHTRILEKGCQVCHHEGKDKKSCNACHKEGTVDGVPPIREAAHETCFSCHYERAPEKTTCAQCHAKRPPKAAADALHSYKKPGTVEMRGRIGIMPAVVFDHKKHEGFKSCKDCHPFHVHTIDAFTDYTKVNRFCRDCHDASGLSIPSLDRAVIYHDEKDESSCAGCHAALESGPRRAKCSGCHRGLVKSHKVHAQAKRSILISSLSQEFEPVSFSHRSHAKMIGCNACHHHSPENKKAPCTACHAHSQDFEKLDKPGLRGAYHRQCMGCHRQMGMGPSRCEGCHEPREAGAR